MNAPSIAKPDKDPAEATPSAKKQDYHTNMPVGEILRRAREHFGQSLNDVEAAIRIRVVQIEAIEKSQYDKLPGRVYAMGFVRSYSEYLGFDGDKMVALFKTQSSGSQIKPELNFPAAASESRLPPLWIVITGLCLFGLFIVIWTSGKGPDAEEVSAIPPLPAPVVQSEEVKELPQDEAAALDAMLTDISEASVEDSDAVEPSVPVTETAPQEVAPPAEASVETPPAEAEQDGITLNVLDNSWVEIKDDTGKALVSRMLKTGDQYFVPNRPDLEMSLGNAGGIEVIMDGKPLPPLGRKGEVRRNISLDVKALKALAAGQE